MLKRHSWKPDCHVSLFTREWIEICARVRGFGIGTSSPSLRGSGLKFYLAA